MQLQNQIGDMLSDIIRYKIQEASFNVGLHVNLITLAPLSYFPTNKCKATRHKT